jgi:hypothetical protein
MCRNGCAIAKVSPLGKPGSRKPIQTHRPFALKALQRGRGARRAGIAVYGSSVEGLKMFDFIWRYDLFKPDMKPTSERPNTERLSFSMPTGLPDVVRAIASETDMSMSQLLRSALDQVVAKNSYRLSEG